MDLKLKQVCFMYAKDNTVSYNLITNNQDHLHPFYFVVWLSNTSLETNMIER